VRACDGVLCDTIGLTWCMRAVVRRVSAVLVGVKVSTSNSYSQILAIQAVVLAEQVAGIFDF
jgi:hypothetical protein